MTGTGEQIQYIHRDETMHIGFGTKLIKAIMLEQNARPDQSDVHNLFVASIKKLQIWAEHCVPNIVGYNAQLHVEHAKFLADKRLKQLGYDPVFNVKEALPWLDEQASIKKEKNFFETRVTEYQSSSSLEGTW
jgi:ribonucleoside-diphosphate reductase beta chain